jgi:hypothetical protein
MEVLQVVQLMVFVVDKPVAILMGKKNTVTWLISRANKFKRT